MIIDYNLYHHCCCRYVTSVSTSDDPSFGPSPFLIGCQFDIPTFDQSHCPGFVPNEDPSIGRDSSLYPFDSSSNLMITRIMY